MKADGSDDRSREDGSPKPGPAASTASTPSNLWEEEEEPAFKQGLRVLMPPTPGSGRRLQLSAAPSQYQRPVTQEAAMASLLASTRLLAAPADRPAPSRYGWFVSLLVIAALTGLGYFAASQSAFAFRDAWQRSEAGQSAVANPEACATGGTVQ